MVPGSYRGAAVIDAVVALASQVLPTVRVIDGPAPRKPNELEILLVGWAPFIERHAVARRRDEDMMGRSTEDGEVACYLAVGHGDNLVKPVRDKANAYLTALEGAVRAADPGTLGADEVSIGPGVVLTQFQDPNEGASVGLAFAVSYTAYI